jgi:Flp pilus assembly protein TadG
MKQSVTHRHTERGSAAVKFVIILVVLMLMAHAGYNYVPVAYAAESLKTDMMTAVVQGLALPGKISPVENVKARIVQSVQRNNIPPDALIDVKQKGNALTAHVVYSKPVSLLPFGIYTYTYRFDHTATPTGFLMDSMED